VEIPTDAGFETLAGFLLYKLGKIPRVGDSLDYDGRRFTVAAIERNRILRVRIEKLTEAAGPVNQQ
jgi:putative hemolysin